MADQTDWEEVPQTPVDSASHPGSSVTAYDPTETTPQDYNNVSIGRAALAGASNLIPSATRSIISIPSAIYQAVSDPAGTLKGAGRTVLGLASKLENNVGYPDPDLQRFEKDADPIVQPFSSWGGFKKTLAEDPASLLTTASIPFTGGTSAFGKTAALAADASKTAKAANFTKKAVLAAANPTDAALSTVGAGRDILGHVINAAGSASSGVSGTSLDSIRAAYAMGDAGIPYANEVSKVIRGETTDQNIAMRMRAAAEAASKDTSQKWLADSKNVMAAKTPIDYQPVVDAVQAQQRQYHSLPLANGQPDPMALNHTAANSALVDAIDQVQRVRSTTNGMTDLEKFNDLKKTLYDLAQRQTEPEAKTAVMGIWKAAHSQLFSASPEYSNLMDGYQEYLQGKTDLAKGLSLGKNTNSGTTVNKAVGGQEKPFQQQLLQTVYSKDPGLQYVIAGADVRNAIANSTPFKRRLIESAFTLPAAAAAWYGHPIAGAAVAAGAAANEIARPTIMAGANRRVGAASRWAGPTTSFIKNEAISNAPLTTNIMRAQGSKPQASDWEEVPTFQSSGGRVGFKSGGRTSNSIGAEVNRVRILLHNKTQHMLSVPDDAIATALHMAKNG